MLQSLKMGIIRRHQRFGKRLPIKADIVEIGISEKEKSYREPSKNPGKTDGSYSIPLAV